MRAVMQREVITFARQRTGLRTIDEQHMTVETHGWQVFLSMCVYVCVCMCVCVCVALQGFEAGTRGAA
jgi:hypothetical protein